MKPAEQAIYIMKSPLGGSTKRSNQRLGVDLFGGFKLFRQQGIALDVVAEWRQAIAALLDAGFRLQELMFRKHCSIMQESVIQIRISYLLTFANATSEAVMIS